ncbi:hypothetical protein Golob_011973 [Gossypium lobatum]|uniref:Uncharacterized protein n=1 Tax=Gossypium lobatum TaxID=34289 RepID=A0A7J8MRM1_9ROSI|nr:hypothetical protein [Gossypium lobatum]
MSCYKGYMEIFKCMLA